MEIKKHIQGQADNWLNVWADKLFIIRLSVSVLVFIVVLSFLAGFLTFIEFREGVTLPDPLLNSFKPVDLSGYIFGFTYLPVLAGILIVVRKPYYTLISLQTYTLIHIIRIICMYFIPLEPPGQIIPLRDIFLESTFYSGRLNLKDLFFSGHVASLFMFYLIVRSKYLKTCFLLLTLILSVMILLQHVHYTIDVIVAPVFSWLAFIIAKKLNSFNNV